MEASVGGVVGFYGAVVPLESLEALMKRGVS